MVDHTKLNITDTTQAIEYAFESNIPILAWGEPGVGKSTAVFSLGKKYEVPVKDVRLSQLESVDLRGLPAEENNKTVWRVPSFFPTDPDSIGILFLDEINKGDSSVQAAAYQLVLDRQLGDYILPKGWRIVAAANPNGDMLEEALANRFIHVYSAPTIRDWGTWASANGIADEVISFLMFAPQYLSMPSTDEEEYAFPSPRTWEYVSRIFKQHGDNQISRAMIKGLVGVGPATEFFAFIGLMHKLPTIEDIIADPNCFDTSMNNPSLAAAACFMCYQHMNRSNVTPIMKFLIKAPIEYQVMVISYVNDNKPDLMGTMPITNWCVNNSDIF